MVELVVSSSINISKLASNLHIKRHETIYYQQVKADPGLSLLVTATSNRLVWMISPIRLNWESCLYLKLTSVC